MAEEIIRMGHLPPMTETEFAAYHATSDAVISANKAIYAVAFAAGAAAAKRGEPMAHAPSPDVHNRHSLMWSGWADGHNSTPNGEPRMTYTIEASVRRAAGITRKIEWAYSGRGSGTQAWKAWRTMRETNATMDTTEPFVSAALYRNGECVESVGAHSMR